MAEAATIALGEDERPQANLRSATSQLRLCHFSTAHTQLKSRSFHRICLPLSQAGARITHISPARGPLFERIDFVSLQPGRSRLRRALFNQALLREILAANASLYHFQDPELLPLALALKLFFRKHVVYDAYEDFPSMARESASIPRRLRPVASSVVKCAEWLAAQCLDGIMTADPFTMRRLARIGNSRKLVFHNFPNLDFFPAPSETLKPFDFVYRGGLSERAGTYMLLDAVRLLAKAARAPRVLLLGYFDNREAEAALREKIRQMNLTSRIEIRGGVDHEDMARSLSQARIGLCPLQATAKFALNIPVKVFEYWACGLPVISSDLPPIRPYFHGLQAGLLFRPGSAVELASSMAWLLDHPDAARAMGRNGRAAVVERFTNRSEARKLLRFCAAVTCPAVNPSATPCTGPDFTQARTCSKLS